MASLTVLILAYCFVSAVNARALFLEGENRFDYFNNYIKWLPHSYDSASTWRAFWQYLGLALFFWAARDWLLEKHAKDAVCSDPSRTNAKGRLELRNSIGGFDSFRGDRHSDPPISSPNFPVRLQRMLWILCINGALIALEGILQRLSGTNKLLWLVIPRFNDVSIAQFGPFAYRSNAGSYLNLIWPVCMGFWLTLRQTKMFHSARPPSRGGSHTILLPCAVLMAVAPFVSTSRGATLIAVAQLFGTGTILAFTMRKDSRLVQAGAFALFALILGLSVILGWEELAPRFKSVFADKMSNRFEIYDNSQRIAKDHPMFGTGAGTFGAAYLLYKQPNQQWHAYAHNDWLETRITFGAIVSLIIISIPLLTVLQCRLGSGFPAGNAFLACLGLSLAGALVHARFDFPFQIYSILSLFILLCAIVFSAGKGVPHAS